MTEAVKCGDCRFWSNESCVKWPGHYIGENANKICEHFEQADAVNHPNHYTQGGIECIDALKAATVGLDGIEAVCTANAIKYLWRWKRKNGVEDINKAIWYLNRLKKEVSKDGAAVDDSN